MKDQWLQAIRGVGKSIWTVCSAAPKRCIFVKLGERIQTGSDSKSKNKQIHNRFLFCVYVCHCPCSQTPEAETCGMSKDGGCVVGIAMTLSSERSVGGCVSLSGLNAA